MAKLHGRSDARLRSVKAALETYEQDHPQARVELHRRNSVTIHARIVDPDFVGTRRGDRHRDVWKYFARLPEDLQSEISVLLLLAPEEVATSYASLEFDHPATSSR